MDMVKILQLVVMAFGVIVSCVGIYKQKEKKWGFTSLSMGVFACVCSIVSLTGIL